MVCIYSGTLLFVYYEVVGWAFAMLSQQGLSCIINLHLWGGGTDWSG